MGENEEWYKGLTADDLDGKHVHVVFNDGTIADGKLDGYGRIILSEEERVTVINTVLNDGLRLPDYVDSVSLVWDERDWRQINLEQVQRGDALVSHDQVYQYTGMRWDNRQDGKTGYQVESPEGLSWIMEDTISHVLHERPKTPVFISVLRPKGQEK